MKVNIYQIRKDIDERRDLSFLDYNSVCKQIKRFNNISDEDEFNFRSYLDNYYEKIYEYDEDTKLSNEELLDTIIWPKFNRGTKPDTPEDFKGHSLSTSDIVSLDGKLYYCDSFGWIDI